MKKSKLDNFKIIGILLLLAAFIDSYFLLTNEHFSQVFWFCNTGIYLLAFGFYFRKSIILTGILIGALVAQIPWVLDFLVQLFTDYSLFGVASYMFDYSFNNIRFYVELDHLFIIPIAIYGTYKLGFHKYGWVFAAIVTLILNAAAYNFSSLEDNVNCVFYSCFDEQISPKEHPFVYMIGFSFLIVFAMFVLNQIIYMIINRKVKLSLYRNIPFF
ncbi:hypothetical protein CMO93_03095 [Candidatus Woesearchaeota archaeon]|nr:hypothetical protein [Candidatus Woesearchaeota archaeon]|tara:strand:- start:5 stop:649 length:645 start_codon:yes stop_codon:yes gene_type:complete